MNESLLTCKDEQRRHKVRASETFNGLDYLEVSDDQLTLTVYFLEKVPAGLKKENVVITGGRRVTDIEVIDIAPCQSEDLRAEDCLKVLVNKPGDFSAYTLRLAKLEGGRPTDEPFPNIDPRYAKLEFSFKSNCPSDLDCKTREICPPPERIEPDINYLAKDYASFRQLILDRLTQIMPEWKERHLPDLGITLVEVLAYVGDYLSYYQDAVATEAYLGTARRRISVRRHARLVDYPMNEGCNARAWVAVETSQDQSLDPKEVFFITHLNNISVTGQVLAREDLLNIPSDRYEVFEPLVADRNKPIQLYQAHNKILFYTWGDKECCLPRGATTATLQDEWIPAEAQSASDHRSQLDQKTPHAKEQTKQSLERQLRLKVGDVLIFEEVLGPKTGQTADADPSHRHAVRLTRVEPGEDKLYNNQPIVEIEWAQRDALPFPLCISALGPAPECKLIEDISVAYGNVVLVDHGRREEEPLGKVPEKARIHKCKKEDRPQDVVIEPEVFRPRLQKAPLTFSQPLPAKASATELIKHDPRQARPQIWLKGICDTPGGVVHDDWLSKPDLFGSRRRDCHFVVEMDNEGHAHLRFGDNDLGRMPEAGTEFKATYRFGNGLAGNIGAETIAHVVLRSTTLSGVTLKPRNPMPAHGGVNPQPLEEVRLFAPTAFRKHLERAITPEDYARLAERNPLVQRAAAAFRWTGSWYEVLVAIDPFGKVEAEQELLDEVEKSLFRYRRMGHDLVVQRARHVPLDVAMTVCVLPGYLRGHVKQALLDAFSNKILPDGPAKRGFFHPDNLTFGQSIRLSKLVAEAQKVPGVESVIVTRLERLFEGPNNELENGILPLSLLEIARLDNDPSFPENGRLELNMKGGR